MIKDGFNEPNNYLLRNIHIHDHFKIFSIVYLNGVQHKYFQLIFKS